MFTESTRQPFLAYGIQIQYDASGTYRAVKGAETVATAPHDYALRQDVTAYLKVNK